MSLSTKITDRLFERLTLTYGSQWVAMWAGADVAAVKSLWASELSIFADRLEAIGWALANLPERPPNLVQFKALCRQAPRPPGDEAALPAPSDPQRVRQAIESLRVGSDPTKARAVGLDGRNGAQCVVDGLIERAGNGLGSAQINILRGAVRMLRQNDPRRDNPIVLRYVPRVTADGEPAT